MVRWRLANGDGLTLAANLSGCRVAGFPTLAGHVFWQEGTVGANGRFGPWAVQWTVGKWSGT